MNIINDRGPWTFVDAKCGYININTKYGKSRMDTSGVTVLTTIILKSLSSLWEQLLARQKLIQSIAKCCFYAYQTKIRGKKYS